MKNGIIEQKRDGLAQKLKRSIYLYLLKEITYILLLSLGVLTFLFVMTRLGKLTDFVINRGVGLMDIVMLIVYSSPLYLMFTLPMAFLLATMVALGRFAADNEILALKASGINLKSLYVPIGTIALIITVFGLLNTHLLLPGSSKLFRDTLTTIFKKGITIDDKEGIFNDAIKDVVIYIDKVDLQNKKLTGVIVSDDRDKQIKQTISAERGIINIDPVTFDLLFLLENGTLHRWEKEKDVYRSISFKDYSYSMNLASIIPPSGMRPKYYEMTRKELQFIQNIVNEDLKYEITTELYKKVSLPFSALAFLLLTVPLGIKRKAGGRFSGIANSLVLFVFYYLLLALTENIGKTFRLPVFLVSFAPNYIIFILGLVLARNVNGEEKTGLYSVIQSFVGRYFEKT